MAEEVDSARRLRPKERKFYTDEGLDMEEIEARRKFCVEEKLFSPRYSATFVKEMKGDEITLKYLQEHGFTAPLLTKDKTGLGMRVPSENFKVSDVKQCVGSRRQLDVMDVNTQKGLEMSMKDWVRYYECANRDRLLNVISLEFSHTRLENYVEQPLVVRQLDWVDNAWPRFLKDSQTECTNIIEKMKYPKVQKYCLMSVKGCYTDFHIDMGGTSVWYHILHGKKTFFLIPPTECNIQLYEHWVLSGKQGDMFFGDKVDKCQRIDLEEGYTFFIPTGWIHAVYTMEDSLVFGGNFLHSLNIPMQLRIGEVEDKTKVPQKFRFPFFQELHWYLLDQYSRCLMGKSFRIKSEEELAADAEERLKSGATEEGRATGDEAVEENQMSDAAKTEEEKEEVISPPRYPAEETTYASSPLPASSKSPSGPSPSASPRQSPVYKKGNEENTAPRSPKPPRPESRSPRSTDSPLPGVRYARSDSKEGKRADQSPGRKTEGAAEPPAKKRSDPDIKTYFNQSKLIRQVSVKLENCLLAGDRTKFQIDSMTSASSSSGYGYASGSANYAGLGQTRPGWIHLTQWELKGLRVLVRALEDLAPNKLSVPKDISDHQALIREIKRMLLDHATDDPEAAITGEMILKWPPRKGKKTRASAKGGPRLGAKKACMAAAVGATAAAATIKQVKEKGQEKGQEKDAAAIRRRRVRCKVCEACTRGDCRECHYCMDMKKYGGAGKMKQSCKSRQCMMPVLPTSAVCSLCGKDERIKTEGMMEPVTTLMECGICWDIIHPECIGAPNPDSIKDGSVNEDLPNSWECPKCSGEGRQGVLKPRVFKTATGKCRLECRLGSSSSETSSRTELEEERSPLSHDEHADSSSKPETKSEDNSTKQEGAVKQEDTPKKHVTARLEGGESSPKSTPGRFGRRIRDGLEGEASPARKKSRAGGEETPKNLGRNKAGRGTSSRGSSGKHTSRGRERRKGGLYNSDTSDFSDFDEDIQSGSSSKESSPVRSQGLGRPGLHGEDDVSSIDGASVSSRKRKESSVPKQATSAPLKVIKLVQQRYAVRPAPIPTPAKHVETASGINHALDQEIWLLVFRYMSPVDLCACMRVCRTWNRWCIDRRLWAFINLSRRRITRDVLVGVVRRQPVTLDLSWTNTSRKQLEWLAARLPQLKHLSLAGNSWAALCALCSSSCPLLYSLNLKWVSGIRDPCMKDLISPPTDHRPGVDDSVSRLHRCTKLELAGSDISDVTLMVMTQYMPKLSSLDLSYCTKITDAGISILAAQSATTRQNLTSLDLTGCNQLTDACFENLKHFTNVVSICLEACPEVSLAACHNFVTHTVPQRNLVVKHEKCMSVQQ